MNAVVIGRRFRARPARSLLLALAVLAAAAIGALALVEVLSHGGASTNGSLGSGSVSHATAPGPVTLTYIVVSSDQERQALEAMWDENRGGVKVLGERPTGELQFVVAGNSEEMAAANADIRLAKQTSADEVRVIDMR